MKSNAKYTAIELLKAAGFEKVEELIGKVRVRIAGIAGIVRPDHVIKIQAGTKKIEIIVGQEKKELDFEDGEENQVVSEAAQKAKEAEGKILNKKAEAIAKAKAEPKAEAPAEAE